MALLSATNRKAATLAPALPINLHPLSRYVKFRQGQMSMIAASPGAGKSVMATNIAVRCNVPVLFFSADSDEYTVRQRVLAILTGQTLEAVESGLKDPQWFEYFGQQILAADHIDWDFTADIDADYITKRLKAYCELREDWPKLIVVDNLGNSVVDMDNEYSELRSMMRELKATAGITQAHVMVLHHVKGFHELENNRATPISTGSLQYNLGKIPEIVLGLNRPTDSEVNLSVPKNRGGKSDLQLPLLLDYSRSTIEGFEV